MYYLYVLLCKDGTLYTGITNNLLKRLDAHRKGVGAKYMRARAPFQLVHSEEFPDKSSAAKREFEIKSWDRARKIAELKLKLDAFY